MTGGLINFNSASNFGSGLITLNGGGLQWAAGSTADISSKLAPLGAGGGIFDTNGNTVTFATGLTGSGGLAKQGLGTLNLTGNNTYTGGTAVLAGTLAINGSVAGNVAVGPAGTSGGNGTIVGSVVNARHARARQLDRPADRERLLHPDGRLDLPGRGQQRRPGRPHQCRRRGGDPGRHGAGAGRGGQLRQQHDLYDRPRHRRRLAAPTRA